MAVGDGGAVVISTNGVDWLNRPTSPDIDFTGVAHGNGLFAATAGGGVFTSADAITWSPHPVGNGGSLYGIAFGHGTFVAVGGEDFLRQNVFTSTNGVDWQSLGVRTTSIALRAVAGGDLGFAVVGDRAFGAFAYPGFSGWLSGELATYWPLAILGVAQNAGQFVAVGTRGTIATARPFDLLPQTWSTDIRSGTEETLNAVDHTGLGFVAVGDMGVILTSVTGRTWESQPPVTRSRLLGVTHGNDRVVAVGEGGAILVTTDGAGWVARSRGETSSLSAVVAWNGRAVAVGEHGSILTSADGTAWERQASGTQSHLRGIATDGSLLVVTGADGAVLASTDSRAWSLRRQTAGQTLNRVAWGGGRFVAVGSVLDAAQGSRSGQILVSTNGVTWEIVVTLPDAAFDDVAYGDGIFTVVGADERRGNGLVLTSEDAVLWEGFSVAGLDPAPVRLRGIAQGNGRFVAVGDGLLLTSENGRDWTIPSRPSGSWLGVRYAAGAFVAWASSGSIGVSADGSSWTMHATGSDRQVGDVLELDGTILTVGVDAHILQTDPVFRLGVHQGSTARLRIFGPVGAQVRIESTSDLTAPGSWVPLEILELTTSPLTWTSNRPPDGGSQFYRAVLSERTGANQGQPKQSAAADSR